MPAIAKGSETVTASIPHPTCDAITYTEQCSTNVRVNGIGIVRAGDLVAIHTVKVGTVCTPHQTALTTFSSSVKVNGLGVGRVGDTYGCGCTILSYAGSTVNVGG